MKAKNIIRSIAGICMLASTSMFVSCEKQLDNVLKNDTYSNAYWKTQGDVESALNGGYGLFRKAINTNQAFFIWGDAPIGKFVTNGNTNESEVYNSGNFVTPYRETGVHNWTNWYRIIDVANLVISKTPGIPDASFGEGKKKNLIGQAYFMRALAYFYMTRVWGGVPLQLTPTETADDAEMKGVTPSDEILKLVVSDAQKASSMMDWNSVDDSERRRGNKGAALALLAHATAFQNDYAKSLTYADSVINNTSNFALQAGGNVRELFKTATAKENIFVVTQKDSETESTGNTGNSSTNNVGFLLTSNLTFPGFPYQVPGYYVDLSRLNRLYTDPNDLRRKDFFTKFDDGPVLADNSLITERFALTKYTNFVFKNASNQGNLRVESNIVIFRLADLILLKSEALFQLNRMGEARTAVNLIRSRAGIPAISAALDNRDLYTEILLERQRELIGEGHSYFDLVRNIWKKKSLNDFQFNSSSLISWSLSLGAAGSDRLALKGYYFPIHNSNLNSNRLITQIPYWMGKY
ncbi:RagB/SusD family nutrient uptake outer membrane protein [Sphingobacterium sp. DK4209]|uniref:RagB/SusD family nutrient uptake outer membrane protein n=1 Tax=Sphingobacterium zhuxiongii TaxID=2662364 RepID=A0A5Q0QD81_9SPHI|nr:MULTISPECIES: RagB/SusD family nutrient uptake outer membrane protein [unclassified Sphingobacterium]MVZ66365.1 RagB/SusD family nutrient uptake outer membrane protein [Sphingobacterium sp. DK4209]QGA25140.1 RagB/SusD family nutrient uptake outer membrane protein [Sphingobacterium sp. dk4302]